MATAAVLSRSRQALRPGRIGCEILVFIHHDTTGGCEVQIFCSPCGREVFPQLPKFGRDTWEKRFPVVQLFKIFKLSRKGNMTFVRHPQQQSLFNFLLSLTQAELRGAQHTSPFPVAQEITAEKRVFSHVLCTCSCLIFKPRRHHHPIIPQL
jgi:hypothetical protein